MMSTSAYSTSFNIHLMKKTKKDIVFYQDMQFLFLDMPKSDIPTMSLYGAKKYTQDIFELILFTHKIFSNNNFLSHVYLVQREEQVTDNKMTRYTSSDGYMLIAAFSKKEFEAHFHTICHAAMAINCGFKTKKFMTNPKLTIQDMTKLLCHFNPKEGTFSTEPKTPKETVGYFGVVCELDNSIQRYHRYKIFNQYGESRMQVCTHCANMDTHYMWLERARLLSWEYYLKQSCRIQQSQQVLFSTVKLLTQHEIPQNQGNSFKALKQAVGEIDKDHPLGQAFKMHVDWLDWDLNVKQRGTETILDIKNRIAWDISQYTFDFSKSRFPILHVDEAATNQLAQERGTEISDMNEEQWLNLQTDVLSQFCQRIQNGIEDKMKEEAESMFPVLDKLDREIYKPFAKSLGAEGNVCRLYQDSIFTSFFGERYRTSMKSATSSVMSNARHLQNELVTLLTSNSMFNKGYMNSLTGKDKEKHILVYSSNRQNVDPLQDAMANYFLHMLQRSGVRQMSIELIVMLLSNIWSFTRIENKPILVLEGAPGSGKSNCASIAQLIMCWKNSWAAETEYFVHLRSHPIKEGKNRYRSVLGTRIVEQFYTLVDPRTTENLEKESNKTNRVPKTFKKMYDVSLEDRTLVILSNKFDASKSLKDRSLIYKVPALNVSVRSCSLKEKEEELENAGIPSHFALIRYLISEQINRDSLNLSLKATDTQKMSPSYETELTLERVCYVLREMGFDENIMSQTTKESIVNFALILAHYRASFEVFGCVSKIANPRRPTQVETLDQYNEYLVKCMTDFMKNKTQDELDVMLAQRVLVDPSDIITASTLVLHLEHLEEILFRVLSLQIKSFGQKVEKHFEPYFVIKDMTLERLHQNLESLGHKIQLKSLKKCIQNLEVKARLETVRNFIIQYDTSGTNKYREKQQRFFNMYVHTEFAAKMFLKVEGVMKKSITQRFVEKCLCENMTSLDSVLYFDRELIYQTQDERDALGFVSVSQVAQSLPEGKLPVWESSHSSESKNNSETDVYSEVLSSLTVKETENKKLTFQAGHRETVLALKRLYATNQINQLIKNTEEIAHSTNQKEVIFREKLIQLLTSTIDKHLNNLYHPLIQNEQHIASDVYHESHPLIKMCISPKRLAEDCDEPERKRLCISN